MKSLLILFSLTVLLYAGKTTYICKMQDIKVNGESQKLKGTDESMKFVTDTTWYFKPTSLIWYETNGDIKIIIPNRQTKLEWLRDSLSKYEVVKNDEHIFITLSKNAPYKLDFTSKINLGNKQEEIKFTLLCIDEGK